MPGRSKRTNADVLSLSLNEWELLFACHHYRLLSVSQFQFLRLGISHQRSLQKRLKVLFELGLLHRILPPRQTSHGRLESVEYLYSLSKDWERALDAYAQEVMNFDFNFNHKSHVDPNSHLNLSFSLQPISSRRLGADYFHRKQTVWFHVLFDEASKSLPFSAASWYRYFDRQKRGNMAELSNESKLNSGSKKKTRTLSGRQSLDCSLASTFPCLATSWLIPDALFEVVHPSHPNHGVWCCLETTMGYRPRLVGEKIESYLRALQNGSLQYDLCTRYDPRILFYFEELDCLEAVMKHCSSMDLFQDFGSCFRFGLFDDVHQNLLEHWQHPRKNGFASLF